MCCPCRYGAAVAAAVFLAVLLFAVSDGLAQTLTDEELTLLRSLSPEQRAEILREYGLAPEPSSEPHDVSSPSVSTPREQSESEIERAMSREAGPFEAEGASRSSPFRSYEDAAADTQLPAGESKPLLVDTALEQFGYDLFAGAPTTFAPATDVPVSDDYVIGPGDEIHIQLYGKTSLSADVVVDREGAVPFPELGPIAVAGLTFREMKDRIAREVANRMIGVEASVSMGRLRSIRIFVLGEVYRPGSYTVSGLATLTNALLASGGVEKIGSLRSVQLKRDGRVVREMDLYDLLLEGDTSDDERLAPGDVIFVPPVGSLAGIAGEVLRPAIYEMKGEMTARDLINLAGGLTPAAHMGLLQLERIESGARVTYDLDLDAAHETTLVDGDLLKIYPILDREEGVVFLEGHVIRPGKRQYFEGMRLSDLVGSTDDLLPETHFDYGLIERESEVSREPEFVAFDLGEILIERDPAADLPLEPRDRVYVFHRGRFQDIPRVEVRGEVRSPGEYELVKDMTVLDLVLAAGGVTRDAWLSETELLRTDPETQDVTAYIIRLGRALEGLEPDNARLEDFDVVTVHSVWEFQERKVVEIIGEVNDPGRYPLTEGMRVSDLIFAGGNLRETAYLGEAELTRYYVLDGERRELRHIVVDLDGILAGTPESDLELMPYDRLLIRRIANWRNDEVVHVSGEVAFPGSYPIEAGERLRDLVKRFGGFLEEAYLPAAVLTRESVREIQTEQLEKMADQLESDLARMSVLEDPGASGTDRAARAASLDAARQLVTRLRQAEATGRMVISLEDAEELEGDGFDVVLADGDHLMVPKRPDFVAVMGQVNNPTAFQYDKGKRAGHYVRLAGGGTRFGDLSRMYVVKADGSVEHGRRARIGPGDVVIVPESLERFSGMQFLLDLSQVLYQLGLAAAGAHTIGVW